MTSISNAVDYLLLHPDVQDHELPPEFFNFNLAKIRSSIRQSSLLRSPRFKGFTLDNSTIDSSILKPIREYTQSIDKAYDGGFGLYLWSNSPGSGKTTIMKIIATEILRTGRSVLFESMVNIKNKLKDEFDAPTHSSFKHKLNAVDVLILDDLGSEIGSKWLDEVMKDIIDERYNQMKVLMITANYPLEKLPFDKKIIDRLKSMLSPIRFPEQSFRHLGI